MHADDPRPVWANCRFRAPLASVGLAGWLVRQGLAAGPEEAVTQPPIAMLWRRMKRGVATARDVGGQLY